jgi:NADH-quinone oxidoreductase subunit K
MNPLTLHTQPVVYLVLAALLFGAGIYGFLRRRTFIGMLISGEIIFAASSLNLMAVNRFFSPDPAAGQIFVLFIMGLAAAEVAIALSIIIAVYRNYRSIASRELNELQG